MFAWVTLPERVPSFAAYYRFGPPPRQPGAPSRNYGVSSGQSASCPRICGLKYRGGWNFLSAGIPKMGYFPNAAFLRRTEAEVALLRLLQLQGRAFDPGVVNVMVTAFDNTLRELKLSSRHDPLVERVAQIIIECAEKGMRDATEMRDCALKAIRHGAEH